MSLFMRVLSVAPREADAVGSLKVCRGGTAVGETREEGGCFILEFTPPNFCRGITKRVRNEDKVLLDFCMLTLLYFVR